MSPAAGPPPTSNVTVSGAGCDSFKGVDLYLDATTEVRVSFETASPIFIDGKEVPGAA